MLKKDKTESLPKNGRLFCLQAVKLSRINAVQVSDTTVFNACIAAH